MAKGPRFRRSGSRWRILVHEMASGGGNSVSHHVTSHATFEGCNGKDTGWSKHHVLDNIEFDELVVGQFVHIEQMNTGLYWMNIAGLTLNVRIDRDGKAYGVDVYGPGDYDWAEDGVHYRLFWSGDDDFVGKRDD